MRKSIFCFLLILTFLSLSSVYAIHGYDFVMLNLFNSAMSFVILTIVIDFLLKLPKAENKKDWLIKFINVLSIGILLKLSSWFWFLCIMWLLNGLLSIF